MEKPRISPIKEMEIRASKISGVVSLAQGIPSFQAPLCVKRKAIEALETGKVNYYSLSPGLLELREAIEYNLSKENINYDFEKEIIITAGSIEGIAASLLTLINPEDEVLVPDPSYASYPKVIKIAKGKPVFFPLKESEGWSFNIEEIKKRITFKTKAILFCNPNNPTGTIFNREQILKILELAECHNFYILADEVYRDFIYDERDFYSVGQFSEFRKRIINIFSFSKSYSMTGWRVAYLAAEKNLAQKILATHDALVTCAPVISQWAALAALEMGRKEISYFRKELARRREIACGFLDKMNDWFEYEKPDSAYYVFPKMKDKLLNRIEKNTKAGKYEKYINTDRTSFSWNFALELLYEAKIALVPGVAFGPSGENHLRICFGRERQAIAEGMERIKKYLEKK